MKNEEAMLCWTKREPAEYTLLVLAAVGEFTPWRLTNARNEGFKHF